MPIALTVTQVNTYIKQKLDGDEILNQIAVQGELSNYKRYPSGHHYFTLKDSGAALKCVMFRNAAVQLKFTPKDGMRVIAFGRISAYPRDGAYQLYCQSLTHQGLGDLHAAYEQLKQKLQDEGLFALEHKKQLPVFPHRIAIVTSSAGAAIQDMLRILSKRYPLSRVYLFPVRVQGEEAPEEIAEAIRYANRLNSFDLLITGRGGGSIEDLWAFNDERVARAIYESRIPVISAVGHEPDVTISDFVADLRAATPSNAAELAVPDKEDLRQRLDGLQTHLTAALTKRMHGARQRLDTLAASGVLKSPESLLQRRRTDLGHLQKELNSRISYQLQGYQNTLNGFSMALDAMSPLKVLGRGYALASDESGALLRDIRKMHPGQNITIQLINGGFRACVTNIWEDEKWTDSQNPSKLL